MKNKKFKISNNVFIIILLLIVMFLFCFRYVYNLTYEPILKFPFPKGEKELKYILCDSSEKLCISPNNQLIKTNEVGFFTLGIFNTYDEEKEFYINLEREYYKDYPDTKLEFEIINKGKINIDSNKQRNILIGIKIPKKAEKGTYVFNVHVCVDEESSCEKDSDNKYGITKKIYVMVPEEPSKNIFINLYNVFYESLNKVMGSIKSIFN